VTQIDFLSVKLTLHSNSFDNLPILKTGTIQREFSHFSTPDLSHLSCFLGVGNIFLQSRTILHYEMSQSFHQDIADISLINLAMKISDDGLQDPYVGLHFLRNYSGKHIVISQR